MAQSAMIFIEEIVIPRSIASRRMERRNTNHQHMINKISPLISAIRRPLQKVAKQATAPLPRSQSPPSKTFSHHDHNTQNFLPIARNHSPCHYDLPKRYALLCKLLGLSQDVHSWALFNRVAGCLVFLGNDAAALNTCSMRQLACWCSIRPGCAIAMS